MVVAMQNFIPDRRALSSEKKSTPAPVLQQDPPARPAPAPNSAGQAAYRFTPSEAPKSHVPMYGSVPDLGISLPIKKTPLNPFVHPR